MEEDIREFIDFFGKKCFEKELLHVPESLDLNIVKSLLKFHDEYSNREILNNCVIKFIENRTESPVTIKDFAMVVGEIRKKIEKEAEEKAKFLNLMKKTGERMKELNE